MLSRVIAKNIGEICIRDTVLVCMDGLIQHSSQGCSHCYCEMHTVKTQWSPALYELFTYTAKPWNTTVYIIPHSLYI